MLIYDGIFKWKGWGGRLQLASGTCRLRIFDQKGRSTRDLVLLKPILVVVSDIPGNDMSVRSCAGNIATTVTRQFKINPQRMIWVEYYPETRYGEKDLQTIPERYDAVEFTWKGQKALEPKWRPLKPPLLDEIKKLLNEA
jgi:hypothetical protein